MKKTPNDKSVTNITVGVQRPRSRDTTDFLKVVCWGRSAEFVCKYFQKGSGIEVSGYLSQRSWTAEDGSKHSVYEIVAQSVEFGKKSKPTKNPCEPTEPEVEEFIVVLLLLSLTRPNEKSRLWARI
ncbi:MAG: single-stranded DNA-binding protein [Oscillospiraceae bacterium]|nr:single-stranded DNA-binding protein [Oscillospiraceae bacterium]